jgi:SNF2 family DNA or RNA helicase
MLWKPHQYQHNAVQFMLENGSGQLWLEPGLGKTSITLEAIRQLKDSGAIKKVLIVAPLRPCYAVWPDEVTKWDNFNELTISVLHGPNKDKTLHDKSLIHVINFEGLQWLSATLRKMNVKLPYDMLVVDEISYLKNTRTQRFKSLNPLLDQFKRRFGLTGSPAPNGLMDIFGPQLVIDRGATFGKYITHFRSNYFYPTGYGGYTWALQSDAEEKIYEALAGKVLRMAAKDYLDLPELMTNKVYVDLPPDARKMYKELEDKLLTDIDSGQVTAATAAVAVGKCQQMANGSVYLDGEEREVRELHTEKIDAVRDIVEELSGQPCLIGYYFKHDLVALQKIFPNAPVIGSGVSGDKLTKIINVWNSGKTPVLLAHPQSAGHGLNLQGAGHAVIWFSNTWSLEIYEQFIRRLWRQGQRNNIIVHQIIARKTIDEAIVAAIESKDKTQQSLMNAIKNYAAISHDESKVFTFIKKCGTMFM